MALLSDVMRKASVVTLRPRGSRVAGAEFSPIVNVIPKVKKAGRPPKAKPVLFPAMPMLANAKKANVDQLFREKVKLCLQMCVFEESTADQFVMAKEDVLHEIRSVLRDRVGVIGDSFENWSALVEMVNAHLMRELEPIPSEWFGFLDFYFLTDVNHPLDWVHIGVVYDIAIAWFNSMNPDSQEKLSLTKDVLKLCITVSETTDDREQEKISVLFSTIYEKVPQIRLFAFELLSNTLSRIPFENAPFTSAKPLLTALTGIVAGFNTPLNQKYLPFWEGTILPLHKCDHLLYFAKELFTCVIHILNKDNRLVMTFLHTLIKYWPWMAAKKQMLFLDEIASVCSFIDERYFEQCVHLLSPHLLASLGGSHTGIVEKTLSMWEVGDFVWLITMVPGLTYPMFIPKILEVGKTSWDPEIRSLCASVMQVMQQNEPRYFDAVGKTLKKLVSLELMKGMTRAAKWKYLIHRFEADDVRKEQQLHILSTIFEGCEALDPYQSNCLY